MTEHAVNPPPPDSYSAGQRLIVQRIRPVLLTPILRLLARLGVAPNLLSLLQIPLGGLMVLVIAQERVLVIGLLLACFALDSLDGLLARRSGR